MLRNIFVFVLFGIIGSLYAASISPKHAHIKYLTSHRNKDISAQHEHGGSSFEPPEDPGMVYVDYIIIGVVSALFLVTVVFVTVYVRANKDELFAESSSDVAPEDLDDSYPAGSTTDSIQIPRPTIKEDKF